ncbi:hypothetical protein REPUB_Repub02eG0089300 [Reevesia pubescens]
MACVVMAKPEMSPSLAPSLSCTSIIIEMADCLSFFTNESMEEKPTPSCCSGFKTVLKTNAECICEALKSSAELGVDLNFTKASTLPSLCHVSTPISNCDVSSSPGPVPATAPPPRLRRLKQLTMFVCYITAANPPTSGTPSPNSPEAPAIPESSVTPTPSTAADEVATHAPTPVLSVSGTYSLSACFFVLISMLVIPFSYISV